LDKCGDSCTDDVFSNNWLWPALNGEQKPVDDMNAARPVRAPGHFRATSPPPSLP
jgi:hypothetical protein